MFTSGYDSDEDITQTNLVESNRDFRTDVQANTGTPPQFEQ